MANDEVFHALNVQLNKELYSAYLYLSMSAYFEDNNLKGCAHWMRIQAGEEQEHAMKIYHYIFDRGHKVKLLPIEAPQELWASPLVVFEEAYAHEQKVTGMIHKIYELSVDHKDYATQSFLQWFITEQVEEEAGANEIVEKMKLANNTTNLFFLDSQLAKRGQ